MAARLRMKVDEARRAAEQAAELVKKDKAKLESRLDSGVIPGLAEDTAVLLDKTSNAVVKRTEKEAATQKQNVTTKKIRTLVMALRSALQMTEVPKPVQKAAGVGKQITSTSAKTALAAADMMIEAYANHTDVMRGAGILPKDIDALTGLANALRAEDSAQESQKVAARTSTVERTAAQRRVELALKKIIAAAELEFVDTDPVRVTQYQSLIPKRPKKKKPAAG